MRLIKYILYPFIIIVVFVICLSPSLGNNIIDRYHWGQKKSQLENIEILKVTFYTGGNNAKNVELTGTDKDNFMNSLLASEFYRSNHTGAIDGGMAIILVFKDGSQDTFEYCGASVFQISYKGNLFSIKNKELEQVLLKYNVVL